MSYLALSIVSHACTVILLKKKKMEIKCAFASLCRGCILYSVLHCWSYLKMDLGQMHKITVSCNDHDFLAAWLTSKSLNMKLMARHVQLLGKAVSWLSMMLYLVRYHCIWLEIGRNYPLCLIQILHCLNFWGISSSNIFGIYPWPKHDVWYWYP